jgi:hypothetical protein
VTFLKMANLEQAMKRARLSITEDDEGKLVIERSMFASRSRGKVCEVTMDENGKSRSWGGARGKGASHSNGKELSAEAKFWKSKWEQLQREQNEEEEDLEHLVEITTEREAKLIELARLLERKVDLIMTSEASDSETYSKLEVQRKLLRFYELMTGLTLQETDRETEMLCTIKNRSRRLVTRFAIELPADEDHDALFSPLANSHLLPEYLRAQISCARERIPAALSDVLLKMFDEEAPPPTEK